MRHYVFAHSALPQALAIPAVCPEHALLLAELVLSELYNIDLLNTVSDGAEITLEEIDHA